MLLQVSAGPAEVDVLKEAEDALGRVSGSSNSGAFRESCAAGLACRFSDRFEGFFGAARARSRGECNAESKSEFASESCTTVISQVQALHRIGIKRW